MNRGQPANGLAARLAERVLREFGPDSALVAPEHLLTYECDAYALTRLAPDAVVFPETTEDVRRAIRLCNELAVPFVARGAGTGLSGGSVAAQGGLVIEMARMNKILEIDYANRFAVVQPGLVNLHLSNATRPHGFHYAPDPSSQGACTLGGNVAENSGGPHTLKYGVTTNHVLALEVVLPDGEILRTGSRIGDTPGFDLTGLFVGSEGTFGIVTEITVRLSRNVEAVRTFLAVFSNIEDASETVSGILAAGIVPAALELIDALAIQAVEAHLRVGFPLDAGAVLLIEIEGLADELDPMGRAIAIVAKQHHCRSFEQAKDEATRRLLWKGRKQALGAVGKIARAFYTHDGVVPRSRLPEAIAKIQEIAQRHGVRVANVCHAGDGNLHPLLLFDPADEDEVQRMHAAGQQILRMCVDLGGTLTGEHGIGTEKRSAMSWLFSEEDLDQFARARRAFDPLGRSNPEKVFPTGARCDDVHLARKISIGGWI